MASNYSNDGYSGYADSKRTSSSLEQPADRQQENADGENEDSNASQRAVEYVRQLLAEKMLIDQAKMPNAASLIDAEIAKVQQMGRPPQKEFKFIDVFRERPIKVAAKVMVPVKQFPKFNFVGKLLGPKGTTLRHLQEETMCRMSILGRGSKKNPEEEEALRRSLDPKYGHLSDDLHVEITALGPPAEAHARMAFALAEVKKYLAPDKTDSISLQQMREIGRLTGPSAEDTEILMQRPFPKPTFPRTNPRPTAPQLTHEMRSPIPRSRPVMPPPESKKPILNKLFAREEVHCYEDVDDSLVYESAPYTPRRISLPISKTKYYPSNEYRSQSYDQRPSSYGRYDESSQSSSAPWTKPTLVPTGPRLTNENRFRMVPYTRPTK